MSEVGSVLKTNEIVSLLREDEEPRTAVESTYFQLRREIMDGTFGPGARLRIQTLKATLQVSGSTIREALTRLASDRLVVIEEQKGFSVAPMSLADLDDLTHARIILECVALRDSIAHGNEEWEAGLVSAFHRLTRAEERLRKTPEDAFDEWELRNGQFHEALVSGSRSTWLQRLRLTLFQQSERYRRLASRNASTREEAHAEHRTIFEAALARDVDVAEKTLREHIQLALNALREAVTLQ